MKQVKICRNSRVHSIYLLVLLGFGGSLHAEPWTNYIGSHYQKQPWANSVRTPGGPREFKEPFSPSQLRLLSDFTTDKDVVLGISGMDSGRNRERMDSFLTDMTLNHGESWKSEIRANAAHLRANNSRGKTAYWQFGNEINSRRFSENTQAWAKKGRGARDNDISIIPYYVEMYLAPGVEAVWQTRPQNAKAAQPAHIPIILGSIGAFANPGSQKFLDALLNYRVEGKLAPSLKGKQVYELVDVVSVHYVVSANTPTWRASMDEVWQKWLGKGNIKSIWSTEELGIRRAKMNAGSVFTAQVFARYMDWWLEKGLDSDQGRAFFWGTEHGAAGRHGSDGMESLLNILGPSAELVSVDKSKYGVSGDNLEYYAFSVKDRPQTLLFVFPRDQTKGATVKQLSISSLGKKVNYKYMAAIGLNMPYVNLDQDLSLQEPVSLPALSMWILEVGS